MKLLFGSSNGSAMCSLYESMERHQNMFLHNLPQTDRLPHSVTDETEDFA